MSASDKKMFVVHCNNCHVRNDEDLTRKFYMSKCAHIFCQSCVVANCPVCARPYNPVAIDNNLRGAQAELFDAPLKMYKRFQSIVKFQLQQDCRLASYYVAKLPQQQQVQQRRLDGIRKLDAKVTANVEREKTRMLKLKAYIAHHQRRVQQPGNAASQSQHSASSRRHARPTTPSLSSLAGTSTTNDTSNVSTTKADDGPPYFKP